MDVDELERRRREARERAPSFTLVAPETWLERETRRWAEVGEDGPPGIFSDDDYPIFHD